MGLRLDPKTEVHMPTAWSALLVGHLNAFVACAASSNTAVLMAKQFIDQCVNHLQCLVCRA